MTTATRPKKKPAWGTADGSAAKLAEGTRRRDEDKATESRFLFSPGDSVFVVFGDSRFPAEVIRRERHIVAGVCVVVRMSDGVERKYVQARIRLRKP